MGLEGQLPKRSSPPPDKLKDQCFVKSLFITLASSSSSKHPCNQLYLISFPLPNQEILCPRGKSQHASPTLKQLLSEL